MTKTLLNSVLAFLLLSAVAVTGSPTAVADDKASDQPNIVWIIPDDMSANFSCYGETAIQTPNVDRLAKQGVKFNQAFVTAPVCSTCRSAFITGMYQTSIGAHHHRSGRGEKTIQLPDHIKLVPKLFQEAGYYTSVSGWPINGKTGKGKTGKGKTGNGKLGKTDYNFQWDRSVYDGADWTNREPGQPFFAQIQTKGGKRRGKDAKGWESIQQRAEKTFGDRTPDSAVTLPPYYPDHPDIVRDWAAYLDSVRMCDEMVGEVIKKLKTDGDFENTLIIFMTDHGISHGRGKQFLYDEGIHVPLIIVGDYLSKMAIDPGSQRDDVVEHIDIAAVSLAAAGIAIPDYMQARNILATDYSPRAAAYSARDRCDETVDHIRSVRTTDFKYIRNFLPDRPYLQPSAYKDAKAILQALRKSHQNGEMNEVQQALMADARPKEELYDLKKDPHEINNLANDPDHSEKLNQMRTMLDQWMVETNDMGRTPESMEMYDSDMKVYTDKLKGDHLKEVEQNIATMKRWASEGK